MLTIKINDFEGPLDLLLHLISEHKINILDIPIALITEQYLEVIRKWEQFDMDIASEFILMAARLLEIKSRMLLPRPRIEKEEEDPREELAKQLIQYSVVREISAYLQAREEQNLARFTKDPEYLPTLEDHSDFAVSIQKLHRQIASLLDKKPPKRPSSDHLEREHFTVSEKKEQVMDMLKEKGSICFRLLFKSGMAANSEELAAVILAVLELYKTNVLDFSQQEASGEIRLYQRADVLS